MRKNIVSIDRPGSDNLDQYVSVEERPSSGLGEEK